jgi:prephenate dehydrogenase
MSVRFERLCVAGVGLIGGSLALAAKQAGLVGEVVGFGRTARNLEVARERGIVDRVATEPKDAVAGADLVLLAAPVGACVELARRFASHARRDAILTDAGSVKESLVAGLESVWPVPGNVVGAHPIAGSEASGAGAARVDLFRGRACVLTPSAITDPAAVARVRALWEAVGSRVEEMPATVHDELLARVSHMPHLVAYALMGSLDGVRAGGRVALDYAGSGLRDTTRIAASPVELWRDIAFANAPAVRRALADFRDALERLERLMGDGDAAALDAELAVARAARVRLGGGG